MNNQPSSKIRKKSFTKIFNKIVFPLTNNPQKFISQHELLHQSENLKQSNKNSQISKIKRTNPKKQSFSSLNRLIEQFQKLDRKQIFSQFDPYSSLNGKNNQTSKFQSLTQKKFRSLTKSRSMTVNNQYDKKILVLNESNAGLEKDQFMMRKRLKSSKHKSLTKTQQYWMKDRDKQRQKQFLETHKFDQEKIDRNYDHLGKLRKKTTHNKQQIKSRFVSFKNLPKEISQIDKETFENARKDFNKKFKTYAIPKEIQDISQSLERYQELECKEQKVNTSSPKVVKKNFLKINPSYNMYKKQNLNSMKNKGEKRNYRVSADQQLLKVKLKIDSEPHITFEDKNQFYSEIQEFGFDEQNSQNTRLKRKQTKQIDQFMFSQDELNLQRASVSENQQTSIYDKVYFFSLKLSAGFASLFTIERINLKSRSCGSFIIQVRSFVIKSQVVICAYEEILVQRIKFDKHRKFQTMNRLKPYCIDDNHEKDKLKSELYAELMARREKQKNKESLPVSVELNSQNTNFQRKLQHKISPSQSKNFSIRSIEHRFDGNAFEEKRQMVSPHQHLSTMNFMKVSPESYQLIINYLQKFCQLEISYLGASLKQTDCQRGMFNQLMKKKHSQMQQTLLESLNLAKVFYFLIKINATYYVSKSVIIANRKIKHYLLYEFSNMIRHEKGCIIEEQEEISQSIKTMKQKHLVEWLHSKVNKFFTYTVFRKWKQQQPNQTNKCNQTVPYSPEFNSEQYPLINALEICFGTLAKVGLKCQSNQIDSERLFKIVQSNYKNDIRWKKTQFEINHSNEQKDKKNYQPFFVFHNSFDFGINKTLNRQSIVSNFYSHNRQSPFLFVAPLSQTLPSKQPSKFTQIFSYTISRNFFMNIQIYPSPVKSRDQIVNLHVRTIKNLKIQDQFRKEQFALLHLNQNFENQKRNQILQNFLKKQYVTKIIKNNRGFEKVLNRKQQHLFTIMKNKKYHINVFMSQQIHKDPKRNILHQKLKIQAQSRVTVRQCTIQLTLNDIFQEIKQFYRLYSDAISYQKFSQTLKRIKTHGYELTKELIIDRVKFYVSKLLLMKKNTYSQFYFVPLPNMVSEASFKSSSIEHQKQVKTQEKSIWNSSILINATQKQLIFQTLQKLQDTLQQKQKHSLSTISKITIKNFPIYEIYYKTVKKLIPGHFVIVSIYYMPMFDLSEVKIYFNRIRKSFWTSVRRDVGTGDYEKIVDGIVQFVKQKYFRAMISQETEKLSSKYRDFYSQMIKQAQAPFLSKARKTKKTFSQNSNLNLIFKNNLNRRRERQPTRQKSMNTLQFTELTEELLCKPFNSPRKNKYIIRLSYPATGSYINDQERKGIDELINISVLKQNCMLIYKFQTTARKLLSKKVTHKFNVIQLQYQQKSKPFYILFQEIKTLITKSDQTTYGLLNTFRGYFLNKHYNNLTTTSFVSMLSLNLLAGVTNNNLQESENTLSVLHSDHLNNPHHSKISNKFIKDLKSTKYQRYCLFVDNNKILEVLKVREKFQKKSLMQSDRSIPSAKSQVTNPSKQFVKRRNERKQSIEAFLTQKNNFLRSSIKSSQKTSKHEKNYSIHQSGNLDFILEESYHINQHQASDEKIKSNYEQKIVYLIDTETEAINQVPSSIEDQGFMINVPFGMYNRKMFKRFFKHLILVREEKEAYQNRINQNKNNLRQTSVLELPQVNRFSLRSSHLVSQFTFQ